MRTPKALLELEGATFVETVVARLRDGGCDPVVVVVPEAAAIEAAARATEATVVVNHDPGEGPITSLRLALAELGSSPEGFLYLPVDHPFVRSETIGQLLKAAEASSAPLVLPMYAGSRGHPCFFRSALFEELNDPTLEGGARTVVHRHLARAELVAVDDPGVLADIDTPHAYADALSARAGSS
jgi:nicotine blue oxidoreductase